MRESVRVFSEEFIASRAVPVSMLIDLIFFPYSGMSGSSPHIAEPALCALADPARLAAANGELITALCVER